ncbi:MAG: hypothetical protein LBH67_02820 [Rickettsia sp.]|jgi:hypothetical protein|nr:hypothetical protein [Rickettsia sp.]
MLNSIRLCQALNEKICHDFAGAIGIIDNSVDLIRTTAYQEKATKLIQDSTNRLISYLEFYRYLYSLPSEDNKISIVEINRLATNFLKSKNHNVELLFTRLPSTTINEHIAQIIICLIVIASNNLSKNAIIKVELEIQHDKLTGMKIVVIDTNLKFDHDRIDILLGKGIIEDVYSNDLKNWNVKQGVSVLGVQLVHEHANAPRFYGANSSKHSSITIENVHEYYTYYLIMEYGYKLLVTPLIDSVEYNLLF